MIFVLPRLSARENMELDSRLPSEGPGSFRVYGWSSVAVTLGFSQLCEVALVSPLPEGVDVAIRPTGGRAVLHGHDVTVGVCVSLNRLGLPDGSRSLRAAYRQIVAPIVDALNEVGVPAALGEDTRFARLVGGSPDCFAHVSANDVVHAGSGAKLCGCALRMSERDVLLQASIPVRRPSIHPREILRQASEPNWIDVDENQLASHLCERFSSFISEKVAL